MPVGYEQQTLDHPNLLARYSHRTRFARSKQIVCSLAGPDAHVLDYGCGRGRFLHELSKMPEASTWKLLGYDPYKAAVYTGYEAVTDPALVPDASLSVLTCLETCEHLPDEEIEKLADFASSKLMRGGHMLITVPIMIGPALLAKEIIRTRLKGEPSDTAMGDLLRGALLAIPPPRAEDILKSHRGFDWRQVKRFFSERLSLVQESFSPLPLIGWYGNSQAILVFHQPDA